MAVIIDMELPQRCEDCRFHQHHSGNDYVCIATPMFYPFNLANYKDGRKDFCPLKSADEIPVLLDNAHDDGFKQGYLQAESDCKVQIDEMIADIEKLHAWGDQFGNVYVLFESVMNIIHKYCDKEQEDGNVD